MVSFETSDLRKLGVALTTFGVLSTLIGGMLFLHKLFLTVGNILFFSGVILTIGVRSSLQFFLKPENYKGSLSFGVGFFFLLSGWTITGMIVETYGFVVLFRGFWPTIRIFMKTVPIAGWIISQSSAVPWYFNRPKGRRVPI